MLERLPTKTVLLAVLLAAAIAAPLAAAHGDEDSLPGYESKVTSVTPAVSGITATIAESDSEVELTNGTGKTVIVYGYEHEPYLRFSPDGVYENERSPAAYLNDDRFGETKPPATAKATAPPQWQLIDKGTSYGWHDHRIHWMSPIPPPVVKADESEPHHVFDWKIDAAVDGQPFAIKGTLDYSPPDDGGSSMLPFVLIGVGVLGLALVGLVLWMRRRGRRPGPPVPEATPE